MDAALQMDAGLANRLAVSVRTADPDRYFSTLFAPAALRPCLFALYALNAELARVAQTVREPMLGAKPWKARPGAIPATMTWPRGWRRCSHRRRWCRPIWKH
jgi:phytoene/squalene synthetase